MEPISIFLIATFLCLTSFLFGFMFGYQRGYADFHYEDLKNLISNFKKNHFKISSLFAPQSKTVILNSKDDFLPEEEDKEEQL